MSNQLETDSDLIAKFKKSDADLIAKFKTVNVLYEVEIERERQEAKWGQQNHHPFHYLAILGEEVGEANKAAVQAFGEGGEWIEYRKELIQVAAVAVAMIECFDRNQQQLKFLSQP